MRCGAQYSGVLADLQCAPGDSGFLPTSLKRGIPKLARANENVPGCTTKPIFNLRLRSVGFLWAALGLIQMGYALMGSL